jgi:hypothetical protein
MTAPRNMIQLPLSGDLWLAPEFDADGNIVPRADTLDMKNMPLPGKMSPDVAAILMHDLAQKSAPAAEK